MHQNDGVLSEMVIHADLALEAYNLETVSFLGANFYSHSEFLTV